MCSCLFVCNLFIGLHKCLSRLYYAKPTRYLDRLYNFHLNCTINKIFKCVLFLFHGVDLSLYNRLFDIVICETKPIPDVVAFYK